MPNSGQRRDSRKRRGPMPGLLVRRLRVLRDGLSFSAEVRNLVDSLNQEMGSPDRLRLRVASHPGGFVRAIAARRISMAEAYAKLTHSLTQGDHATRLAALRHLVHYAWHAKTLSLPLNTARVQIALMKECVRAQGNRNRQLELMQDFAVASYGQEAVIRRLLRELGLIEIPDDGRSLAAIDLAHDGHVHDSSSLGRKTPSQLLLDAFIKGVSKLTVAYYDFDNLDVFDELYEAANILGISVEVGVEFSVGPAFERRHYMYVPPLDGSPEALRAFLAKNHERLQHFRDGLAHNATARQEGLTELLEQFNQVDLPQLNSRFDGVPVLQLPPVSWDDVRQTIPDGRVSRAQVGYVLAAKMRPTLHRRVLYVRNQLEHALFRHRQGGVSSWETAHIRKEYERALEDYRLCTPYLLQERYAGSSKAVDRPSAFPDLDSLGPTFLQCGGRVSFIHPLSVGLQRAAHVLVNGHRWITDVETFNMSDTLLRDPADLRRLNRMVGLLNSGDAEGVLRNLQEWGCSGFDLAGVQAACAAYQSRPLSAVLGSDYMGGHPEVPGMGFIGSSGTPPRTLKGLRRHGHPTVPQSIARTWMRQKVGAPEPGENDQVYFVSRVQAREYNVLGEEAEVEDPFSLVGFWRYLNPGLRLIAKAAVAMVPATLMVGPWYALLWLGITAFRNATADILSSSGLLFKSWSLDNVDKDNLGNSVFWTGFSVPILAAAKQGFDVAWPFLGVESGFLESLARFWVIAFANGLYISTHNRIRGFPPSVIRGNFFRTVLSWPLATFGSYVFTPLGIPAIVQSKVWSDVVAGIIEGTGKFVRRLRLRQRDLLEVFAALRDAGSSSDAVGIALVDLLYVWARRDRGRAALRQLLAPRRLDATRRRTDPGHEELTRAAYDRLLREVTSEGSIERLTCAILMHFDGGEAETLTRLVGEHHDAFVQWLTRLPKAAGP
jgi:hypothetical protein